MLANASVHKGSRFPTEGIKITPKHMPRDRIHYQQKFDLSFGEVKLEHPLQCWLVV